MPFPLEIKNLHFTKQKIKESNGNLHLFQNYFWIGSKSGAAEEPAADLVNCVNIYKDSVNSGSKFTDYQLRSELKLNTTRNKGISVHKNVSQGWH